MELPATAALDFPTVLALAGFVAQSVAPAAASAEGALASAAAFGGEWDAWSDYSGNESGSQLGSIWCGRGSLRCIFEGSLAYTTAAADGGAGAVTKIVGLSCTYAGPAAAEGVAGFWGAAAAGADLPAVVPYDRWAIERHYSPDVTGALQQQ